MLIWGLKAWGYPRQSFYLPGDCDNILLPLLPSLFSLSSSPNFGLSFFLFLPLLLSLLFPSRSICRTTSLNLSFLSLLPPFLHAPLYSHPSLHPASRPHGLCSGAASAVRDGSTKTSSRGPHWYPAWAHTHTHTSTRTQTYTAKGSLWCPAPPPVFRLVDKDYPLA